MPCFFSGIFFVQDFEQRTLNCLFRDEFEESQHVQMTYFSPSTFESENVPEWVYQPDPIQPGNVYFISGNVAIKESQYMQPSVSL